MTWLDEIEESGREVNPFGGSNEADGRDGACTPKWLADELPEYDVDPCSNPRSHIKARVTYRLDRGENGLHSRRRHQEFETAFVNPPYARGAVMQWVDAWCTTEFTFLLRWDPSTAWFSKLWPWCWGAWFPHKRINFDPPPGVTFSSNPFPHALYFRSEPKHTRLSKLGYFVNRID